MAVQLSPFKPVNRDLTPAYRQVLTSVNNCINLFEELNQKRNVTQWVADWAVGERKAINFESILYNLKKLKTELEKGIQLNSDVCVKLSSFEMIDNTYRKRIKDAEDSGNITSMLVKGHETFLQSLNADCHALSNAVSKLESTGVFEKKDYGIGIASLVKGGALAGTIGGVGGGTVGGLAGGAGVAGVGGSMALASAGYLSSVPGATALASAGSSLMTTSLATSAVGYLGTTGGALAVGVAATGGIVAVGAVVGVIGSLAYYYTKQRGKERGIKYQELKFLYDALNTNQLLAVFQTHHKIIEETSKSIDKTLKMCDEHIQKYKIIDSSNNSRTNIIRATRIYDNVMRDNLQMLLASEPEMNESMRKRMATNIAKTACKTFLKETLRYSDSDVDEFIQNLQ